MFYLIGFTTESTGMNTFSGKRPRDKDMAYLSTPAYLRQIAGTERQPKGNDPMSKLILNPFPEKVFFLYI